MTHTASLAKFDYTVEDFADVGCVEVKNLTSYTTERVRNAVGKMASLDSETRRLVQNYNAIWSIKLADPGKQNVLDAIAILMERDDVKSATPNMRISLEPVKPEITPLTDAQMAEINAAWLEEKGYPAKWFDENEIITRHFGLRYYGTYGGYQILFAPGTKASGHEIYFDNILLNYETEFALYAYHSGELFSAQALYESGALNSEDITAIARYHAATELAIANRPDLDNPYDCISPDFPALELLPQEMRDQIEADYRAIHEYDLSGVIYCGTYNGCVVFVFDVATDAWNPHNIGGQYFELGSCMDFIIYKDGEFLPSRMECSALLYAFNHNYLTASDIEKIEHYARTQMEALGLDAPFASPDLPQ